MWTLPFEVLGMQDLSFEIILSRQCGKIWHVIGAIGNNQLVEHFVGLLVIGGFEADDPFLLFLVTVHFSDLGLQTKVSFKLEMIRVTLQILLNMGGRRV